ncbi:hypothetical protein SAMN05444349_10376 [Bacteroides faecichinchillae]|uniref:Uncharacterized protein n=1 Tax=Bacteroides faecichinchillae TaxID=871325 RepID=A0A1M4UA94_9BACE|nr:hypothetical protein SAMN05444349_10376 [Bacteroides faecichinchillae]
MKLSFMYLFYPCITFLSHMKCFLDERNMNEVEVKET